MLCLIPHLSTAFPVFLLFSSFYMVIIIILHGVRHVKCEKIQAKCEKIRAKCEERRALSTGDKL